MRNYIEDYFDYILVGITIIIVAILFIPKTYVVTVETVTWKSVVEIEKLKTYGERGWHLPSGARLEYKRREVREYGQLPRT